ncbi:MAG TPA: DUF4832 domain-containing protein [Anaerolineales bacterium]|nr:DUF4832 domain-containing protein [Anaerolineales bacterium]
MMKPRNLIKTGIVLGEIIFLGFIATLVFGQFLDRSTNVPAVVANQTWVQEDEFAAPAGRSQTAGVKAGDSNPVESIALAVECGPPADWVVYQVRAGDTAASLMQAYGISAVDLQKANCLGEAGVVIAGMSLFVPPVAPQMAAAENEQPAVAQAPTSSHPAQQAESAAPAEEPEPTTPTEEPTQDEAAAVEAAETVGESEFAELDLRNVINEHDDNLYFSNPGMGWQYQGGTFPMTTPAETVAYSQRNQISWKILNPTEGVYNWGPLDSQLNTAVGQGKQYSFRVYTMIGEVFGGAQVPQWVLNKGAVLLPTGEPNYANCTYQQEWGKFVSKLIARYDGNPNIAYIDISGYGNFNEWSWQDQTEWDEVWSEHYANGTAGPDTMSTMDSYARRRLADIFIGGSYTGHECVDANNNVQMVNYSYSGFKSTQLMMPFAGLIQSTQYVYTKTRTVGFRHDCLGRDDSNEYILGRLMTEINGIWPKAPVIYETCKPNQYSTANATALIQKTHPVLLHDVNLNLGSNEVLPLVEMLGYEYSLNHLKYQTRVRAGQPLNVVMEWQNDGISPSYPKMGQRFELHLYLVNTNKERVADLTVPANISSWMPAASYNGTPPVYEVEGNPAVPQNIAPGVYHLEIEIVDTRTGEPIWLPNSMVVSSRMSGIMITN